jgi:tetratricopeptide (TPR) repeat protein
LILEAYSGGSQDMKSHLYEASGDEQNLPSLVVPKKTSSPRQYRVYRSQESFLGLEDSDLRSHALKFAEQGDYQTSIVLLNQLIARHPENAANYNNRGLIYFQSGLKQKACADYNTAIQLDPNLASAYNNRANYYAACGELNAALADYDKALDLNPSHVRAWMNRGITLRDLGQYEEAIYNFEVALMFGQFESNIIAQKGRTYHLSGDWNCAIADYRQALDKLTSDSWKLDGSGWRLRLQVEDWLDELLSPIYPVL